MACGRKTIRSIAAKKKRRKTLKNVEKRQKTLAHGVWTQDYPIDRGKKTLKKHFKKTHKKTFENVKKRAKTFENSAP